MRLVGRTSDATGLFSMSATTLRANKLPPERQSCRTDVIGGTKDAANGESS
jgi:hypothetical protein